MATTPITPYVRIVSGKGTLSIPESFAKAVRIFLYVDVIRENKSVYRSFRVNPPESFFARITANIGNYVLQTYSIDYDRQVFELFPGDNADIIRAIKCLEKAVRNYEVLGSPSETIPFLDQLAEFEPPRWNCDNFKFVCFGSTALRLELKGYEPSLCGEDDSSPTPPPPPPQDEPFDKVPPDEPIEVSPPEPDREEDTDPFEGDTEEEPGQFPVGQPCEQYIIVYNASDAGNSNLPPLIGISVQVTAPIEGQYYEESPTNPGSFDVGYITGDDSVEGCLPVKRVPIISSGTSQVVLETVSITPIV